MRPYCRLLLACASLLSAWAVPAYAGTAQAPFTLRITLNNPLYSGGTGGVTPAAASSSCTSRSGSAGNGAVVTVACEGSEFVSLQRQPGAPFLDADRDADRFVLQPGALVSPLDDALWYPGTGTVTTMQVHYGNRQEETMEIRVNF